MPWRPSTSQTSTRRPRVARAQASARGDGGLAGAALAADDVQRVPGRAHRAGPSTAMLGVGLVAAVDRDQVGGQRLDLAGVAQPAGVDAAGAGDGGGQVADLPDGVAVLAEHQHVPLEVVDLRVVEQHGGDVVERRDHRRVGQDLLRLLGRRAGGDREREGACLSKPSGLTQSTTILPASSVASDAEQVGVALVGHGDDDQVGSRRPSRCRRRVTSTDVGVRGRDLLRPVRPSGCR